MYQISKQSLLKYPWASADFFFQGRAKFYYLPKNIQFSSKKPKNILFWPARGGQGPPLALPCGHPWEYPSVQLTDTLEKLGEILVQGSLRVSGVPRNF